MILNLRAAFGALAMMWRLHRRRSTYFDIRLLIRVVEANDYSNTQLTVLFGTALTTRILDHSRRRRMGDMEAPKCLTAPATAPH